MTNETKQPHTPGPWDYDIILDICTESNDLSEGGNQSVDEANARLIAAAPELLEACEAAYANLKPAYSSEHIVIRRLRAAISAATGKG